MYLYECIICQRERARYMYIRDLRKKYEGERLFALTSIEGPRTRENV